MSTHPPLFVALALAAKERIKEVSIHEIKQKLDHSNNDFILIDVREDHEWQQGHLPFAQHISKGVLERDIEKLIPDLNREIILYCSGGYRSAIAADHLQKMGYKNIYSLQGGTQAWREAGYSYPII